MTDLDDLPDAPEDLSAAPAVGQAQPAGAPVPPGAPNISASVPNDELDALPSVESSLSQAYRQVGGMDPEHAAKVISLAKRLQQPEAYIDNNLPMAEKAAAEPDHSFFQEFQGANPKAAQWLLDHRNMAVAKDDLPNLGTHEQLFQAATQAHTLWQSFKAGLENSGGGLLVRGTLPELQLEQNPDLANSLATQVGGLIGDFPFMVAGGIAGGAAGGPIGASAGAFAAPGMLRQALIDSYQKGEIKDVQDLATRAAAILKEGAKQGLFGALTGGAGAAAGTLVGGTVAPLAAEVATMTTAGKAVEGELPKPRDFLEGAILVGGMHGATAAGGKIIDGLIPARVDAEQAEAAKTFLTAAADASQRSKLLERLPEAYQTAIKGLAQGTPVETAYIPAEDFTQYFQGKNLDPAEEAQALGVEAEFRQAQESSGNVPVPIENLLTRYGKTEHLSGLAGDVTFDPAGVTFNQQARIESDAKAAVEKTLKDADQAIQADAGKKAGYDAVYNDIRDQRMALKPEGLSSKKAKAFDRQVDSESKLWASRAVTESTRRGISPEEWYAGVRPQIVGEESPEGAPAQTLNQSARELAPTFYSKLERTVEEKMGGSATPEQINGMLREIKPEERKYSGLDGFLAGKEKVSKEELLDFLRENQVQVKEVTKGAGAHGGLPPDHSYRFDEFQQQHLQHQILNANGEIAGIGPTREAAIADLHSVSRPERTKFEQYTLPGGENYREVLFTLPERENAASMAVEQADKEWHEILAKYGHGEQVSPEDAKRLKELSDIRKGAEPNIPESYRSPHWDEPNVLAHTRLSDRTDLEGHKILHVEEIQSDWHQEGRKKGYKGDDLKPKLQELKAKIDALKKESYKLSASSTEWEAKQEEINKLRDERDALKDTAKRGVPDAPFKKTWHEFVLKHLLRMAAEGGYDKLVWTKGEQQAERYDLSKQVDSVGAHKNSDGTFDIEVYKDGRIVHEASSVKPGDLDAQLGKDLTQKIVNEEGQQEKSGYRIYKGLDLKVGGEGMRGFYDKILPDFVNKYTKKWGGKVGETEIKTGRDLKTSQLEYSGPERSPEGIIAHARSAPYSMREYFSDVANGVKEGMSTAEAIRNYGNIAVAEAIGGKADWSGSGNTEKLHSLEITPAMREAVLHEGQTLFQMRPGEKPADRSKLENPRTQVNQVAPEKTVSFPGHEYEKAAHTPGLFTNEDTGEKIRVTADTQRKAISFARTVVAEKENPTKARQHMLALQHMGELIKNAVLVSESHDTKDRPGDWQYYFAPLRMDGKDYLAKLEVSQGKKGPVLHNYVLVDPRGLPANPPERAAGSSLSATSNPRGSYSLPDFMQLVNAARDKFKYFQDDENPRGSVTFTDQGTLIRLGKSADASTFLHESAHVWLKDAFDYAKANEGALPEGHAKDLQTLRDWLGMKEGEDAPTVEQHEKFARGFEAYLREGESPSEGLKKVFRTFRTWLTRIYRDARSLNVELSDPVREVMDRMLATEDEIAQAESKVGYTPLPSDLEGIPDAVKERLQVLQERAHGEAVSVLLKRQMEEISKDRKEFLAKRQVELTKELREKVRNEPLYASQEDLQAKLETKKPPKAIAQDFLSNRMKGEKRATFEAHAELSGFTSGDEMAKKYLAAPNLEDEVQFRVKEGLSAYSDLKDREAIQKEAMAAIHNEHTVELMALEREALKSLLHEASVNEEAKRRRQTEARIQAEAMRAKAKEMTERLNVRAATAFTPLFANERRAALRAAQALAEGDYERAGSLKYSQMLNHALAIEALRAAKKVEKWRDYLNQIRRKAPDFFGEEAHFNQVAEILRRLGFERTDYNPDRRQESLAQWQNRMQEKTNTVAIAPWILNESQIKPIPDLKLSELQDVVNAVKNVVQVARFEDRAYTLAKGAELSRIVADLKIASALNGIDKTKNRPPMVPGKLDQSKSLINKYLLSLTKMQTLLHKMDGYKDGGKWSEIFYDSVYRAANDESVRMAKAREGLEKVWSVYDKKERATMAQEKVFYPELGTSATKMQLIMMALNLGNEDNRAKLFQNKPVGVESAIHWDEGHVMDMLQKHLDSRDWKFVQSVWDLINEQWPDIEKLHDEMTGFAPPKVEAKPLTVKTADGKEIELQGGYFPLKEDPRASAQAHFRDTVDSPLYTEQNPAWRASTKTGHTIARTGAQYSVTLNPVLIHNHLRDVIHDLAFRSTVTDLRRLLMNKDLQAVITSNVGLDGFAAMRDWVQGVAGGNTQATDALSSIVRALRQKATIASIFIRPSVFLQHLANPLLYAGAVEDFGWKDVFNGYVKRGFLDYHQKALWNWSAAKEMRDFVYSLSPFMKDMHENPDRSLSEATSALTGQDSKIQAFAGTLIGGTLELSSIPMWLEAYNKALDKNFEQDEAVRYADRLIERVQGSGRKYDAPGIQRAGEFARSLSMFYTFLNAEFNRWSTEVGRAQIDPAQVPRFLGFMASRLLLFTTVSGLLAGRFSGQGESGDELKKWLKEVLGYPLAMFPGLRDVSSIALDEMLGLKSFGYHPSPAATAIEASLDTVKTTGGYLRGQTDGQRVLESASKSAAYLFPYPDQFNAWFWNGYDAFHNGMQPQASDLYRRRPRKER